MALAIQKGGKDCIETISKALECIECGKVEDASNLLVAVKSDGSKLETLVQETLKQLERLELDQIAKEKDINYKIGQLVQKEEELKVKIDATKSSSETRIAQLKQEQWRFEYKVKEANVDLQRAQQRTDEAEEYLAKARRDRRKSSNTGGGIGGAAGGILGGVIGFFVGGPPGAIAGAALGSVSGSVGGKAIAEAESYVGAASANLNQARQHKSRCESYLSSSIYEVTKCIQERDREISTLSNQIRPLESEISKLKQEREKHHEEVRRIREFIVFMKEAQNFWGEFGIAVNSGTGRADLLQNLIDKAKKNQNPEFTARVIKSRASKRTIASFIDAWDEVEHMVHEDRVTVYLSSLTCN